MSHKAVTTLISANNTITDDVLKTFQAVLSSDKHEWLCPHTAVDIFHNADEGIAAGLKDLDAASGLDIVTQPLDDNRRKKVLISDMDSTIIGQECIDEMADYVGIKDKVSLITERAMNGELDFQDALRERVGLLKGLPEEALNAVYDKQISIMAGAPELVATMKKNGAHCVLVSGGFTYFSSKISQELGFDEHDANILEFEEGIGLRGTVVEPILDKESKLKTLQQLCKTHNIAADTILAVGDGANDLPMLQAAGIGVAYHAKEVVRAQTNAQINNNDLSALLYIQGYKKDEFVRNTNNG